MGWEGKVLAHFWLEASDNIFFILVFIFQNKTIARQRQRGGKEDGIRGIVPKYFPLLSVPAIVAVSPLSYTVAGLTQKAGNATRSFYTY